MLTRIKNHSLFLIMQTKANNALRLKSYGYDNIFKFLYANILKYASFIKFEDIID